MKFSVIALLLLSLASHLHHHQTQAATTTTAPPPPPPTLPLSTVNNNNNDNNNSNNSNNNDNNPTPDRPPSTVNTVPGAVSPPAAAAPGSGPRGSAPPEEGGEGVRGGGSVGGGPDGGFPGQGGAPGGQGPRGGQDPRGQRPPLPVWAECLGKEEKDAPTDSSVPSLFRHWCSNYDTVIPCVEAGLSTEQAENPLDLFVKLHFDAAQVRTRSEQLCPAFIGVSDRLQCLQQKNTSLEEWCQGRFSQGLQYVFAVQFQGAFNNDPDVYKQLACQVTSDTSGCLGAAMATCDAEVKEHVLAYYALYTNDSCVADPALPYTTPAPPPTQQPPPRDVVITCAQRVAQTVPTNTPLPDNATQLEQLVYGLRQNCRSFEARYNCYDLELQRITSPTFRDVWLSFTFDSANAIRSQKDFCLAFEGGVVGSLTTECYNRTQPGLRACEDQYGQDVVSVQRDWANGQLDNVGVHQAACRTSMQRAECLREAFLLCGEGLAESMVASELGTLPDICFTLPGDNNNDSNDTTAAIDRQTASSFSSSSSSSATFTASSSDNNSNREPVPAAETTDDRQHHTQSGNHGAFSSSSPSSSSASSSSSSSSPTRHGFSEGANNSPSSRAPASSTRGKAEEEEERGTGSPPPPGVAPREGKSTGTGNGSSAPCLLARSWLLVMVSVLIGLVGARR